MTIWDVKNVVIHVKVWVQEPFWLSLGPVFLKTTVFRLPNLLEQPTDLREWQKLLLVSDTIMNQLGKLLDSEWLLLRTRLIQKQQK